MSFVILSESGYSCSDMARLYSWVKIGAMKGDRSRSKMGLILNMSFALLGLSLLSVSVTIFRVVSWRIKGGSVFLEAEMQSFGW